jgi:nitrilase
MSGPFKVAAVQAAPAFLNLDAGIDKAVGLIEQAAAAGARLIGFPETWLPGYPWWIWLDAPAVTMPYVIPLQSATRSSAAAHRTSAWPRPRATTTSRWSWASPSGTTARSIWPSGTTAPMARSSRGGASSSRPMSSARCSARATAPTWWSKQTDLGRIGALCCWEHLQPLNKYALYSQNEQIHVASWPSFSLYKRRRLRARRRSSTPPPARCTPPKASASFIAACATVSQEMVDMLCDNPMKQQFLTTGGGFARIFGPDGAPMGNVLDEHEEGLVIAEIDLDMISVAKAAGDPCGHYSRPDVFRLMFNQKPSPVVMAFDNEAARDIDRGRRGASSAWFSKAAAE